MTQYCFNYCGNAMAVNHQQETEMKTIASCQKPNIHRNRLQRTVSVEEWPNGYRIRWHQMANSIFFRITVHDTKVSNTKCQ